MGVQRRVSTWELRSARLRDNSFQNDSFLLQLTINKMSHSFYRNTILLIKIIVGKHENGPIFS